MDRVNNDGISMIRRGSSRGRGDEGGDWFYLLVGTVIRFDRLLPLGSVLIIFHWTRKRVGELIQLFAGDGDDGWCGDGGGNG